MIRSTLSTSLGLALLFSCAAFATGCTGATDTPETGLPPAPASSKAPSNGGAQQSGTNGGQGTATDPATQEQAGDPSAPATDESGKPTGSKPGANEPPAAADPACVASCTTNMKTKCNGDDTFCADICAGMTTAQVACIGSAPTCDKPEWIRCVDENPGK